MEAVRAHLNCRIREEKLGPLVIRGSSVLTTFSYLVHHWLVVEQDVGMPLALADL